MQINITAMMRGYRAACRAVGIDPAVGPATRAESRKAILAFKQRDPKNPLWWRAVDWQDHAYSHSETEFLALLHIWIQSIHAMFVTETEVFVMSENHRVALRELLAARGKALEWVEEDGEIQAIIVDIPRDPEVDGVME